MGDVFEAFMVSDVVNDDDSMGPSVVAVSDCTESLLSGGIPLCLGSKLREPVCTFRRLHQCI